MINSRKSKKEEKELAYSKNVDFDNFFIELESKNLALERIKSKSTSQKKNEFQTQNLKSLLQQQRDPEIFDNLVITKLTSETIESFLAGYNIHASTLQSISLLIGKIVYSFKIYNVETMASWQIRKTITEFDNLFKKFRKFLAKIRKQSDITKSKNIEFEAVDGSKKLLKFDYLYCKKNEETNPSLVLTYLDDFLNNLFEFPNARNFVPLFDFLELSCIFYPKSTEKYKECYLKKKPGGRFRQGLCTTICNSLCSLWVTRWFLISKDGIKYCIGPTKEKCLIQEMLLFDNSLKIEYGFKQTGSLYGIIITTTTRRLLLKATSLFELYDFIASIEEAIKKCDYIQENRFSSFAPQREQKDYLSYCKFYVDGQEYYSDLYEALNRATNEVFITDWWLSPELYLKRPLDTNGLNNDSRLDYVLGSLAKKGVKIYIIVYKEVSFVLPLNSHHTKTHLEKLSPNIKVLQHPSDLICWWSHHEKIVIIDQEIAFMGGLDLCFGRMDNHEHKLLDLEGTHGEVFWPGIDYSNSRIRDFRNVENHEKSLISRDVPRMPWHDIAIQVYGIPVKDLARHFVQYWNYAKVDLADRNKRQPKEINVHERKKERSLAISQSNMETKKKVIEIENIMRNKEGTKEKTRVKVKYEDEKEEEKKIDKKPEETDWNNDYDELKLPLDLHIKNYMNPFNLNVPPDPFHKAFSTDNRKSPTLFDTRKSIKKSFTHASPTTKMKSQSPIRVLQTLKSERNKSVERIDDDFLQLYEVMEKKKENFIDYEYDLEDYINSYKSMIRKTVIQPEKKKPEKIEKINENFYEQNMLQLNYGNTVEHKKFYQNFNATCKCQIVRSASNWSCGLAPNRYEDSIHLAYLQLIEDSEHYIYIENQFFISNLAGTAVENNIAKALLFRIKKAHKNKENFKVIVVMPLLPGFEGPIDDKSSSIMRIQLHWEYYTISRSETSLIASLKKEGIEPNNYLFFLGLRTHAKHKKPVTEMVYVHSKLMILDDRFVIMGSANINDRSMLGNRDSEIGVFFFRKSKNIPLIFWLFFFLFLII